MQPFIEAVALSKIYKSGTIETVALQGLSLQIRQGTVVALIGTSGSGKSSFLNILGGLDQPTEGTLLVGQVDITQLSEESRQRYRRDVVGFVWQEAGRNLLPYLSVEQNLQLPLKLRGISTSERIDRVNALLDTVGISHLRRAYPRTMSGGEQQRLAITLALAHQPGILLADEPTGSLDSETTATIMSLFHQLAARFGVTIVIVTHDPDAATHVDQCFAIQDGRIYNSRPLT